MKNLIYKELKLDMHPTVYIYSLFAIMLLIPNYPLHTAFIYTCMSAFFIFLSGRENKDLLFTASLPVRKSDIVKSRILMVAATEVFQVLISIPFIFIRMAIYELPNAAGIEANAALLGSALIMYGVFNLVYMPVFYKTAAKPGIAFLFAGIAALLYIGVSEALVQLIEPLKTALDSVARETLWARLTAFAAGALVFAALTALSCAISKKRFEKVDM